MTKAVKEIKGSFLKATEKKTEVKAGNFCKGRVNFPLRELRKDVRKKVGKFLKGKHSFLMSHEKQKVVIKQKHHLLIKGGSSF